MATSGIGGGFNKEVLTSKLQKLSQSGQDDETVRLVVAKNGKFEVRTDRPTGLFGRLKAIAGKSKQTPLKQQQQIALANWVDTFSNPGPKKTSLVDRSITVKQALNLLTQSEPPQVPQHQGGNAHINQHPRSVVQGSPVSQRRSQPAALSQQNVHPRIQPRQVRTYQPQVQTQPQEQLRAQPQHNNEQVKELSDLVLNGGDSAPQLIGEKLKQTTDLKFVTTLQQSLSPARTGVGLSGSTLQAYRKVQARAAQLTGIEIAKEKIKSGSPDPLKDAKTQINSTQFSSKANANTSLANEAKAAAKTYIDENASQLQTRPLASRQITQPQSTQPRVLQMYKVGTDGTPTIPPRSAASLASSNSPNSPYDPDDLKTFAGYYQQFAGVSVNESAEFEKEFAKTLQEADIPPHTVSKQAEEIRVEKEPLNYDQQIIKLAKEFSHPEIKSYNSINRAALKHLNAQPKVKAEGARFKNIRFVAETGVSLTTPNRKGGDNVGQIHANHMPVTGKKSAIATQYPHNSPEQHKRFWTMVGQQKTDLIVDLTQEKDGLTPYYPQTVGETLNFDDIQVTLTAAEGNYFTYEIRDPHSKQAHTLNRFNADYWPDKKPLPVDQLAELAHFAGTHDGLCVHCKAGVGRTASVYAAIEIEAGIKSGKINQNNYEEKIAEIVLSMKMARGEQAVQTQEQYNSLRELSQKWLSRQIPIQVN